MKKHTQFLLSSVLAIGIASILGCSGGGESAAKTNPGPEIPPFYADLRQLMPAQTNLGYGPQSRTFPVWHLMGPWTAETKQLFRDHMETYHVANDTITELTTDQVQLNWQDVPGEPNMQYVTVTLGLERAGAYDINIGAWCQRPDWLPWPTVGEIHIPQSSRPFQPMAKGACRIGLAAQSCAGVGDVRVLEQSENPPAVKVEVRFSEPLSVQQRAAVSFHYTLSCFPDCGVPENDPIPADRDFVVSDVLWQGDGTVVLGLSGELAGQILQNANMSGALADLTLHATSLPLGYPDRLISLADGGMACAMDEPYGGILANMWSFPETGPSGAVFYATVGGSKQNVNVYPEPTEASREQGHPNPYLLPQDATP
jgi:hypothetical protein